MNTNTNTSYLVGREIDNEFWCNFETDSLEKAREFLQKKLEENTDKSWWTIYQRQVSFCLVESHLNNKSKEEQLINAIVASM